MRKRLQALIHEPFFILTLFLFILCVPHFLKGEILGPFDLLISFYHPYRDIVWNDPELASKAVHYKNYLQSDAVSVVLPVKLLAIQYIKQGLLPLWNPLLMNGIPLFANIQSALLYPSTLLYFFFSAPIAYTLYILLQPILAFWGMYLFLKNKNVSSTAQIIGSLSFTFSAYIVVWLAWGTIGHTILWTPWILYCVDRFGQERNWKHLAGLSFATAFSMLAGHTQTALLVCGISFLYILRSFRLRGSETMLLTSLLLGIGISSMQLIPSIEMYFQSGRELLATNSFYKDQTLHLSSFIQMIFPDFFGNPVTQNWWGKINYAESALYFGALPLLFALFAMGKRRQDDTKFWIFIFLLGILLSMNNPISYFLYSSNIPVFSSSTFGRNSLLIVVSGAILAAYGVDHFIKHLSKKNVLLISTMSIIPLLGWGLVFSGMLPERFMEHIQIIRRNMLLNSAVLIAFVGGIGMIQLLPKKLDKKLLLHLLLIGLTAGELFRFTSKYTVFSPIEFFYPTHPLVTELQEKRPARYYQYVQPNTNAVFGISTIEGSEPLYPRRLGLLAASGNGSKHLLNRAGIEFPDGDNKPRLYQLFSVEYLADKQDNYRNNWTPYEERYGTFDDNFQFLWTDRIYMLYKSKHALPQEKLFFTSVTATNAREAIRLVTNRQFDPLQTVVLENDYKMQGGKEASGTLTITSQSPLGTSYLVNTNSEAILATTNTWYPGWKAYIDEKETPILISNAAFRSVRVPKGTHSILVQYEPSSVQYGLYGSLLSLALLGILLYWNNHALKQTRDRNG